MIFNSSDQRSYRSDQTRERNSHEILDRGTELNRLLRVFNLDYRWLVVTSVVS